MKKIITILFVLLLTACSTGKTSSLDEQKKIKTAEINIQLGLNYLAKQDTQRAKRKLLVALRQAPTLPEAWYSMGYFMESTGDSKEAGKYYAKAVSLGGKRGDVQNNYGTYLCRNGEYAEAIKHFMIATKDPDYLDAASAYENAGLCSLKIHDKEHAIQYFRQALAQDPDRRLSEQELAKLSRPER